MMIAVTAVMSTMIAAIPIAMTIVVAITVANSKADVA